MNDTDGYHRGDTKFPLEKYKIHACNFHCVSGTSTFIILFAHQQNLAWVLTPVTLQYRKAVKL